MITRIPHPTLRGTLSPGEGIKVHTSVSPGEGIKVRTAVSLGEGIKVRTAISPNSKKLCIIFCKPTEILFGGNIL